MLLTVAQQNLAENGDKSRVGCTVTTWQDIPQLVFGSLVRHLVEAEGACADVLAFNPGRVGLVIARIQAVEAEKGVLAVQAEPLVMYGTTGPHFITGTCVRMLKDAAWTAKHL